MFVNSAKHMINKCEEIGSLDVVPGIVRRATEPMIVKEVAIAAAFESCSYA